MKIPEEKQEEILLDNDGDGYIDEQIDIGIDDEGSCDCGRWPCMFAIVHA